MKNRDGDPSLHILSTPLINLIRLESKTEKSRELLWQFHFEESRFLSIIILSIIILSIMILSIIRNQHITFAHCPPHHYVSIITRGQFSHSGTITITMTISRCSIDMVILDQQWHCLDLGGRGCYWGLYLGLFHLQVMKIVRTLCQWQRWWWKCSGCLTARRTSPTTMFLPSLSLTGTFRYLNLQKMQACLGPH